MSIHYQISIKSTLTMIQMLISNPLQTVDLCLKDLDSLPQSSQSNPQFESQSYSTLSLQDGNEPLKSTSMVQCPICTQLMKYVVLDKHLDGCTNGDSSIPPSPPPTPANNEPVASFGQRSNGALFMQSKIGFNKSSKSVNLGKKPGKVVYAMQKDKDMKKILKVCDRDVNKRFK
ncbi:hypothetical protein G6F36_015101 [Rhizopus arrhizus]|nr:hypothetical protein G6F36_015101 [Rhizopus arrhizus]